MDKEEKRLELIETCLLDPEATDLGLQDQLLLLQRAGIFDLIFADFFALRNFSQRMEGLTFPARCLHIVSHPNVDSIKMIWNIVNTYDSFNIFLRHSESTPLDQFKDALYYAFSLTDNVGYALEDCIVPSLPVRETIQILEKEFDLRRFLVIESEGLSLPNQVVKCLRMLRARVPTHSKIFYFPNNQHGLALANAFYALRLEIDGLAGSVLAATHRDLRSVNLIKLSSLYQNKKNEMFSKRSVRRLDRVFNFLNQGVEKKRCGQNCRIESASQ
jgi:hypothetical protein